MVWDAFCGRHCSTATSVQQKAAAPGKLRPGAFAAISLAQLATPYPSRIFHNVVPALSDSHADPAAFIAAAILHAKPFLW